MHTNIYKIQIEAYLSMQWYLITVGIDATEINTMSNHCSCWKEYQIFATEIKLAQIHLWI